MQATQKPRNECRDCKRVERKEADGAMEGGATGVASGIDSIS